MIVRRPRQGEPLIDWSDYMLGHQVGGISGVGLPFDLSDEEAERRYEELLEREAKKRPPGFAAWPE